MGRPWTDYVDLDTARDHLRTCPPELTGGALRAYVGAVLDRVSVTGGVWLARELGVRNPARYRLRLERQIADALEGE